MGTYENTMLKLEQMAQSNTALGQQWQERMSNTSHQREVRDLVAAGLNPVLSSGGQGAASYTTQVDSAVNGIAGMASAREGANATRYAARQSAAATRAAAAAQIEAARIAERASNYRVDNGNPVGVVKKAATDFLNRTGLGDYISSLFSKDVKQANSMLKSPNQYFKNPDRNNPYTVDNLSFRGQANLNRILRTYGFDFATRYNMQIYLDAFLNDNKLAQQKWNALLRKADKLHTNARR